LAIIFPAANRARRQPGGTRSNAPATGSKQQGETKRAARCSAERPGTRSSLFRWPHETALRGSVIVAGTVTELFRPEFVEPGNRKLWFTKFGRNDG
jgi:hypothetical protein